MVPWGNMNTGYWLAVAGGGGTFVLNSDFTEYASDAAFDADWPNDGTHWDASSSTDSLHWYADRSVDNGWHHDLGAALSDTAWIMRIDSETVARTNCTTGAIGWYMGMKASNTTAYVDNDDSVGWRYLDRHNDSFDSISTAVANGSHIGASALTQFTSPAISALQTNYMEIIRDGDDFTFNIYSDASYSTLVETQSETVSGLTGLRYVVGQTFNSASSHNGIVDGEVHKIAIKDETTTW